MPVEQRDCGHDGADGGEAHLTQADLTGPSCEHDDGTADHGQRHQGRPSDEFAGTEPERHGAGRSQDDGGAERHSGADLGQGAGGRRHFPDAARQGEARLGFAVQPVGQELAYDDGGEDDGGQHCQSEGGVGRVLPGHPLFEDPERHGGGGDHRQLGEVAQGQGGQGGDEGGQAVGRVEGQAENGGLEEDRDEREDAGHDPGDRLQSSDRDAEHGGPVAAVPGRLDGDADVALGEPESDAGQAGHGDDDGNEVIGVQDHRIEVPGRMPGKGDGRTGDGGLTPDARDQEAQHHERLGEADGGDGEDQPGGAPEPAHHEDLEGGRQDDRTDEAGEETQEVIDPGESDESDRQHRRGRAQVALREVHDFVEPEGKSQPEGHERAEEPEDRSLHPDPDGHGEKEELESQHRGDRNDPRDDLAALLEPQVRRQRLTSCSCELAPPGGSLSCGRSG